MKMESKNQMKIIKSELKPKTDIEWNCVLYYPKRWFKFGFKTKLTMENRG